MSSTILLLIAACGDAANVADDGGPGTTDIDAPAQAVDAGPDAEVEEPLPLPICLPTGAVGDGVADDTMALAAGLACAMDGHGTLQLAAGRTYRITKTLGRLAGTCEDWAFDGAGSTIVMADGVVGQRLLALRGCKRFTVQHLTLDGNRDMRPTLEATSYHAVHLAGVVDFVMRDVNVIDSTCDGFYVSALDSSDPSTYPSRGRFLGCSSERAYRQGMSIINGSDLQIIGGAYNHTNGTLPAAGIDLEPNPGSATPGIENVLIHGVRFEGNEGGGVLLTGIAGGHNVTIEDSTFVGNAARDFDGGGGFAVYVAMHHVLMQRNVFTDHGPNLTYSVLRFPSATDNSDNIVRDNTFMNNPLPADKAIISVANVAGVRNLFTGNVIKDNGGVAVRNGDPTGACFGGNLIDGTLDAPASACPDVPVDVGYLP